MYIILLHTFSLGEWFACLLVEPSSNKAANQNVPNAPPPASDTVIGNVTTNVIQGLLRSEWNKRLHSCILLSCIIVFANEKIMFALQVVKYEIILF